MEWLGSFKEVRRCEVRMVQHVEKLRAELHLKSFPETEVLERGEVHGGESRPVKTCFDPNRLRERLPQRSAQAQSNWGSNASKCRKASVYAPGRRIATGNELRMIHGEVAVETSAAGIASSAEGHGERRTARRGNDSAKLPSAEDVRCESALWSGHGYLARQYDHFWEWTPRTNGRI